MAFSAAVIVTTPQKLAFIDVAKGIRMFAKLMVGPAGRGGPCRGVPCRGGGCVGGRRLVLAARRLGACVAWWSLPACLLGCAGLGACLASPPAPGIQTRRTSASPITHTSPTNTHSLSVAN